MLANFQNPFTGRLSSKFLGTTFIKYPITPETRRYTTLWNINVIKKIKQPEVYSVIYDISHGIIATGFRSGETSDYDFITNLLISLIFKIAQYLAKLQERRLTA